MKCLLFAVFLLYVEHCRSANILAFLPTLYPNHDVFQPLLKELAFRGHNVTVVSPFALKDPPQNYHHIDVSVEGRNHDLNLEHNADYYLNPMVVPIANMYLASQIVLQTLNNTKVKEFIYSDDYHFDVVLFDNFYQHCLVTMGHKFGAHVIQLLSTPPIAYFSQWHSQPFNPSFIPDPNSGYTDHMSFVTRTVNFLIMLLQLILYSIFYMPKQNEIMFKHFNYTGWENRPTIEEMTKNISLTLINTHFTIGTVKPLVPNFIEVAGMHLKPASKLLKGLQELMDNSTDGVVYVSFGSVITPTQLPRHWLEVFIRQLGQIKQNVLWEWESDNLPELPSNVVVNIGFPQKDILGHPNCVLFITHSSSIHNTEEAIYYGVPMLTISFFGDQQYNSIMMESKGAAIRVKYTDLTEHVLRNNLHNILSNASFKENAIKLSKMFHDQPMKPLDKAIYWVEYVIRHNGAHHLKTAGNQLNWFQFMSIDVIAELIIFLLIFIFILFYIIEKMYKAYIEPDESDTDTDDDKKKNN